MTITSDAEKLQDDLIQLAIWENKWLMRFHPEKYPSIDISNSTKVLYGQGADLVCTLDPGWSRCAWKSVQNDEEIFSITSCINITTTNYSLICNINIVTLHVDTPVHQEVFECAGYYFIGDETHSPKGKTMIFIYTEPPRVQILPSSDPTEFFSFKLLCIAIGQPIPTVVWKYENEEISRAVGENTIVFPKLNRTDSGNYSCEGISSYLGTTMKNTSHYILTVQYTPFARIKNLVVSCSDNVSIDCLIEEGMPTKYNLLRWEHRFNGTFIQNLNISDMQYFINHVTISDLGEYVCVVSNGVKDINGNVFIEGIGNLLASSCSPVIISLEDSLLQGILTLELRVISIPPVKEVRLLHNREYIYKKETEEGAENDSVIVISCISVVAVAFIVFVVIIWMRKRKILKPGMSFRKSHKKFRLDDEGYDSSGKIDEGTCINPCEIDDQDARDGNNMESGSQKDYAKTV
ncbi:opioid-binding protein/cell adhesion molecule-like [Saccostrea echinata]|uniref:opioid-binding protein/cell adhesion molecule-like n=1 Tax=Saccostrea echinata TaxID=191078 RepID=UPI002A7FFFEE|nr:opioid-binding protein/cell adhesion molecule-like [Saccostrea echinata]